MDYHLPDQMSFGAVGQTIVLLDLAADRYFQLRGAEAVLLASGEWSERDAPVLESLATKDILRAGPGPAVAPVIVPEPTTSAVEAAGREAAIGIGEVGLERMRAALHLRYRGLAATVRRWRAASARSAMRRHSPRQAAHVGDEKAAAVARGYAAARLRLPAARLCVPDSLALLRCLWRRGVGADLFFGVRLDPFAAHAWVQRGEMVLSDSVGAVAEYRAVFRL